jgi:hypothetical protein
MKSRERAILGILFLFAALTCSGIAMYSKYQNPVCTLELPAATNSAENRFSSELNTLEDDQVFHVHDADLNEGFGSEIQAPINCSLIPPFSFSVWQPPKIS